MRILELKKFHEYSNKVGVIGAIYFAHQIDFSSNCYK